MLGHWVIGWILRFSYPAVFLLLLAAGLGLPISEDLVVVTGGAMVAASHGSLALMIAVVYCGKLSGDFCLFRIGWKLGPRATESKHIRKVLRPHRVARVERFFEKYGVGAVFMARFLPGLRAPTYLIAGMTRFSAWKFVLADGTAALFSAPLLTWLGYRYGQGVVETLEHSGRWVLVGLGALVAVAIVVKLLLKRRERKLDEEALRAGHPPRPPVRREA